MLYLILKDVVIPSSYIEVFTKWNVVNVPDSNLSHLIPDQIISNHIRNEIVSSYEGIITGDIVFYDNGSYEIRDTSNVPELCTVLHTNKADIVRHFTMKETSIESFRNAINNYRYHFDFGNYNPTVFYISRVGDTIHIRYKHEKEYDVFAERDVFLCNGVAGGLYLTLKSLGDLINAKTEFNDGYTKMTLRFKGLSVWKDVKEFEFNYDSCTRLLDPVKIVNEFHELGLIDSNGCIGTDFSILDIVPMPLELPLSETISMVLQETMTNCILYQHNEEKVLVAQYLDGTIMYYKVSDNDPTGELTKKETAMFFEDFRNKVIFKDKLIRRE